MLIMQLIGERTTIQSEILLYCFKYFKDRDIWLIDSLQILDPYATSRRHTTETRAMLQSIRIARPFTFHQLRDKIYTLTKLPINKHSTIIISSMDIFNDDSLNEQEMKITMKRLLNLLNLIQKNTNCQIITGWKHGPNNNTSQIRSGSPVRRTETVREKFQERRSAVL